MYVGELVGITAMFCGFLLPHGEPGTAPQAISEGGRAAWTRAASAGSG
jgi:hypothetical protein